MAVAAIPVALSLAGAGLSAASSIMGAEGTKSADEMQAARLNEAAAFGQVQATQTAAKDTENLSIKLDNIDAVRAAQGNDPTSPTTAAIRSRTSYLANEDQQIQVSNIVAQSQEDVASANYLNDAGSYALTMGEVGAGASLTKAIGGTNFGSFGFPGGGGGMSGGMGLSLSNTGGQY